MSKDDKPTKLEPRLRFPEFKGSAGCEMPAMSALYGFCPTNTLSRDQLNYDAGSIYNIHYGDIHTKFQTQFRLDNERVPFINPTVAEELGDRFTLVPDHDHDIRDVRRVYGPQYVPEQGFTGYFMQHLGLGRFHAGAETGSENDSNWMSHTMDSSGAPGMILRSRPSCHQYAGQQRCRPRLASESGHEPANLPTS